jgi:hypothetical protein
MYSYLLLLLVCQLLTIWHITLLCKFQSFFNHFVVYICYLDKCYKYKYQFSIDVMLRFLDFELMILINFNYHGYLLIDTFW